MVTPPSFASRMLPPRSAQRAPTNGGWVTGLSLAAAFIMVGLVSMAAFYRGSIVDLFYHGCDSFCYSQMAASIRDARAAGRPVDYFLRDDQTEFLVKEFKATDLPERDWREVVAPHGYHYFRVSGQVGPQYPPGAPWALSFFRPVGAIHDLNRMSVVLIALVGLLLVVWCARRRLVFSIWAVATATYTYLAILTWLDQGSFSINVTLVPLFAGIILAWFARERAHGLFAIALALLAGMGIGLPVEDRVASVLLIPSMLLFFLPRNWGLMLAHLAGIVFSGLGPVLLHNKLVAGGFFLSTYDAVDAKQSFQNIWPNLLFYIRMWQQTSIAHVALLTLALVVFVGGIRCISRAPSGHWRQWSWDHLGLILTPLSAFVIGMAFFLTQAWRQGYYPDPSTLTIALTLALLFVSLEIEWQAVAHKAMPGGAFSWVAVAFSWCGVVAVFLINQKDLNDSWANVLQPKPEEIPQFDLPAPLLDKRAWIWADDFSGSVRLETGHPGFKTCAASPKARWLMYNWVQAQNELQYIIEDGEATRRMIDEAHSFGWKTTLIGYVRDAPCYRLTKIP